MNGDKADISSLLDISRHEGPVWQISWAHPKFGCILASCSYDGKVFVWREQNGQWSRIKEHTSHTASGMHLACFLLLVAATRDVHLQWRKIRSTLTCHYNTNLISIVNSVAWAPHELGPLLACASSDGRVSILSFKGNNTTSALQWCMLNSVWHFFREQNKLMNVIPSI